MLAAAALVIAAGTASAQTYHAEVPRSFKVGNKAMVPGSYNIRVSSESGTKVVVVRNVSTHESAMLASPVHGDVSKEWAAAGNPMIALSCTAGSCRLAKLWTGYGDAELSFAAPKSEGGVLVSKTDVVTLAMVRVR